MESPTNRDGVDRYLARLIQVYVNKVIGKFGFTEDDRIDIERDLLLHVLTRLPKFDPTRSAKPTFFTGIVRNRLRNIIASRKAALRSIPPGGSLNETVEDDEGWVVERIEVVSEDQYLRATGRSSRPSAELCDLHIDFRRAVEALPPGLQEICLRLLTQTITEIAGEIGVSTATVYDRIRKIRKQFEERGLGRYL